MTLPSGTASALDALAHDVRNELNVVGGGLQLLDLDDAEIVREVVASAGSLARVLERLIVSARVEIGRVPRTARTSATDALRLATRRAVRERCAAATRVAETVDVELELPVAWLERLLADLLHLGAAAGCQSLTARGELHGDAVHLCVEGAGCSDDAGDPTTAGASTQFTQALVERLASALGGRVHVARSPTYRAVLELPRQSR